MRMVDVIQKKRDGFELTEQEISFFVNGFVKEEIPDYQVSAFLMAVFFRHMTEQETFFLTKTMKNSGQVMDLSSIQGIKVDKHSTGGVGDKTTIILAPMVAACGVKVAKLSGRGLGHTGGTIDKLESIPHFRTSLTFQEWSKQVNEIGIAIAGGNEQLVPADKKIYALRDVTATIEEISLIASSIMSKKLASGADAFVLDVKVGSGAFMKNLRDARSLAEIMVKIAKLDGKKACAFLTNMDVPLGRNIGNALEIAESVDTLMGKGPEDLTHLCVELASKMVEYGTGMPEIKARELVIDSITSGKAMRKFEEFVKYQGGQIELIKDPEYLYKGNRTFNFYERHDGWISTMDTEKIGLAAMVLGAGREKKESKIEPGVGLILEKKVGDYVESGERIARIFYRSEEKLKESTQILRSAIHWSEVEVEKPQLIFDLVQ